MTQLASGLIICAKREKCEAVKTALKLFVKSDGNTMIKVLSSTGFCGQATSKRLHSHFRQLNSKALCDAISTMQGG